MVSIKENQGQLSGANRAAIFMLSLGPENSKALFERMEDEEISDETLLIELKELMTERKKEGKDAMVKKLEGLVAEQIKVKEKAEKKADSKKKRENSKEFRKLLYAKNVMCDLKYFRDLPVKKQSLIIQQMREIKNKTLFFRN